MSLCMAGEEDDIPLMRGLTATLLMMIEEVVRGASWEVAWSMCPLGDFCASEATQLGTLILSEYSTALGYIDSLENLKARREGGLNSNSFSNIGGGGWRKNAQGQWYRRTTQKGSTEKTTTSGGGAPGSTGAMGKKQ